MAILSRKAPLLFRHKGITALVALLALVPVLVFCALCIILSQRTLPTATESQHIISAFEVKSGLAVPNARIWNIFLQNRFSLGNSTLIGNAVVLPFLRVKNASFMPFYATSMFLTILTTCLLVLAVRYAFYTDNAKNATPEISVYWLAGICAAFLFILSPIALIGAVSFTVHAAVGMAVAVLLLFYVLTRRTQSIYMRILYSFALLLAIAAKPEWGIPFIFCMLVVYCIDEFRIAGWKNGFSACATMAGVLVIAALWCQDWLPGYSNISKTAFVFNMSGVVLVFLWLGWILRGTPSSRRALAFAGPAVLLLLLWLTFDGNGTKSFLFMKQNVTALAGPFLESHAWKIAWFQYSGSIVGLIIKTTLAIAGCWLLVLRWPGLVFLFVFYLLQMRHSTMSADVLLYVVNLLSALLAGVGVVQTFKLLEKMDFWQSMCGKVGRYVCYTASILLLCLVCGFGAFRRAKASFGHGTGMGTPFLHQADTAQGILAIVSSSLPPKATFMIAPDTPVVSCLALRAYSRLTDRNWEARAWPTTKEQKIPTVADFLILIDPGTNSLCCPSHQKVYAEYSSIKSILDKSQLWRREVQASTGQMTVSIYTHD